MTNRRDDTVDRDDKLAELHRLSFVTEWSEESQKRFLKNRNEANWESAKLSTIDRAIEVLEVTAGMFGLEDETELHVYSGDGPNC